MGRASFLCAHMNSDEYRVNFTLVQNGNLIVGTPYLRIKQKIPKEMLTKHGMSFTETKDFRIHLLLSS